MKYQITTSILLDLLSGKKTTAKTIAEKYGVSERSAHRYIELLSLSVPISVKRGRNGGVSISDTYKLPVGFMTAEEYDAVLESLTLAYQNSAEERFLTAKRKLAQQEKREKKEFSLRENAGTLLIDGTFGDLYSFTEKLRLFQECIRDRKILEIEYLSEQGERSKRKIEPHLLLFSDGIWKTYAFCRTERDFRLFWIGRIVSAFRTEERYRPRPFDESSIPIIKTTAENCIEVRLAIDPSALLTVQNRLGAETLRFKNGKWIATALLPNSALTENILSLGTGVEVLSPAFLRTEMEKKIELLTKKYFNE